MTFMAQTAYGRVNPYPSAAEPRHVASDAELVQYIDLKLAALGHSVGREAEADFLAIARPLLRNIHQKDLMLGNLLCPADQRIQAFLDDYLKDVCPKGAAHIPGNTFLLDRPGLA